MVHLALHFLVPAIVTGLFFRNNWKTAYLAMIATMIVDVDHVVADPIYDPNRCSIGFHRLHELWFIVLYVLLSLVPLTRLPGIGLTVHMALDAIDCQLTSGVWIN